MSPTLASLLIFGWIGYLFRREVHQAADVTGAIWLPFIWLFLSSSRALSEWLSLFGLNWGGVSIEEGSPLDACLYFGLILVGLYILNRRRVRLARLIRDNPWLFLFFAYCFLAVFWSDFPFVALKRWIKILGHPIMALILFSEPDPKAAFITLMKRCGYIVVPISILFIKYYPEWGRTFSFWTGAAANTGITADKNMLGVDCLLYGLFFFWYWLQVWRWEKAKARTLELFITAGFLFGNWWLMSIAKSSTSLVALSLAIVIVFLLGREVVNRKFLTLYVVAAVTFVIVLQTTVGVWDYFLSFLGKDSTLTDRTIIWEALLKVPINPLLGMGFESFWLGERVKEISSGYTMTINEAHNGYLETYLNLGYIGLGILICLLFATYSKVRREVLSNFEFGRFCFAFFFALVVYNWTEAAFKATSAVWFIFYVIAVKTPQRGVVRGGARNITYQPVTQPALAGSVLPSRVRL